MFLHILEHYKEKFTHLALFSPLHHSEILMKYQMQSVLRIKILNQFSVNEIAYHPSRCITMKENSAICSKAFTKWREGSFYRKFIQLMVHSIWY